MTGRPALPVRALVALAATLLALAACGGSGEGSAVEPSGLALPATDPSPAPEGDDEPGPAPTTAVPSSTAPPDVAACGAVASLLVPVALDPPAGSDEEGLAVLEAAAATLVAEGPPVLVPGATRLRALLTEVEGLLDAPEGDPEAAAVATEVVTVLDSLITWSAGACEVDGPRWGCFAPSGFQVVGGSSGGGDGMPTPEAVVEGQGLVEVDRDPDEVLFAEVGPGGLVTRTELVVGGDDGWNGGGGGDCTAPAGGGAGSFTPIGEPVG